MSSIYGIWDKNANPISPDLTLTMKKTTSWWEIDGQEEIERAGIYLGKAVFDTISERSHKIKKGQLPFDIVADVRLDNREELNTKLNISVNDQLSDTDYILKTYEKYGEKCVDHLIGAFAFVIYRKIDHSLFCARDHIGVKPLHYYYDGDRVLFGTEKKSLLCIPSTNRAPNWAFIMQSMMRNQKKEEDTEYMYIRRLPAASTLTIDKSGVLKINRYWKLDTQEKIVYKNEGDYVAEFIHHMKRAVSDRMRNAHNIGSHLSGGLDSSGISGVAASLAKSQGRELHAFSYTVPKEKEGNKLPFENENPFVMDQVKLSDIKNHHRIERPIHQTMRELIEAEARIMDGIPATNNLATEYEIQYHARDAAVDVLLSGFPGDELVTSFVRPYYLEYLERGSWLKYFTSKHRGTYSFKKLLGPLLLKAFSNHRRSTEP